MCCRKRREFQFANALFNNFCEVESHSTVVSIKRVVKHTGTDYLYTLILKLEFHITNLPCTKTVPLLLVSPTVLLITQVYTPLSSYLVSLITNSDVTNLFAYVDDDSVTLLLFVIFCPFFNHAIVGGGFPFP